MTRGLFHLPPQLALALEERRLLAGFAAQPHQFDLQLLHRAFRWVASDRRLDDEPRRLRVGQRFPEGDRQLPVAASLPVWAVQACAGHRLAHPAPPPRLVTVGRQRQPLEPLEDRLQGHGGRRHLQPANDGALWRARGQRLAVVPLRQLPAALSLRAELLLKRAQRQRGDVADRLQAQQLEPPEHRLVGGQVGAGQRRQ